MYMWSVFSRLQECSIKPVYSIFQPHSSPPHLSSIISCSSSCTTRFDRISFFHFVQPVPTQTSTVRQPGYIQLLSGLVTVGFQPVAVRLVWLREEHLEQFSQFLPSLEEVGGALGECVGPECLK